MDYQKVCGWVNISRENEKKIDSSTSRIDIKNIKQKSSN